MLSVLDLSADVNDRRSAGKAFRGSREAIGWTTRQTAQTIGMTERRLRAIEAGERPVPELTLMWLTRLAHFHLSNPPPDPPAKRLRLRMAPR